MFFNLLLEVYQVSKYRTIMIQIGKNIRIQKFAGKVRKRRVLVLDFPVVFFRSRSCDNSITLRSGMTRHHLVINLLSWGLMKHLLFSFQASRRCCKQLKTSQLINSLSSNSFARYHPTCQQKVLKVRQFQKVILVFSNLPMKINFLPVLDLTSDSLMTIQVEPN